MLTVHPSTLLQTEELLQALCFEYIASSRDTMAETLQKEVMSVSIYKSIIIILDKYCTAVQGS